MFDWVSLIQNLSNGVLIGSVYALIGIGLTLIFGVMRVINFAHGDFVVLGMYVAVLMSGLLGWDPYFSLVVALPLGFVLGSLVQKVILARIIDAPPETSMLATLGVSLVIANVLLLGFGGDPQSVHVSYASSTLPVGSVNLSMVLLLAGLATVMVTIALYALLNHTELGRAIRATAENRLGAELVGVDTRKVQSVVFGLGVALALTAGVALIPMLYATPTVTGPLFTLKAFVVTVLGGLGNIGAAIAGGLVLGIVEILGASYLSSEYRDVYGLIVFLAVLLFKPEGLFGKSVKRV
ncbi:branched-chain amino acid ABC transporter permease [Paenalcaligenes suwonensis]|uniref:branched-chain amino acid ABC transporter permease n=1 Tax=Paenalcaligenes suwonensis TaxID=1202713 RepID=UPI00140873D5|nr:branched-chain amino acid ABC transporter permease [Paenalcaligenes suwonensis]NHC62765.1 branched-chain amino acid ABC transporter permease [Paenalcaligenes suwonensis]